MFKSIPGFSKKYTVSKSGKVKGPRKILKPQHSDNGYETVFVIDKDGKTVRRKVSRLLALAWIRNPNPDEAIYVDHINRKRLQNTVDNLRWIDAVCNNLNNDSDGCYETTNIKKPFRARVQVDGQTIQLGYYKTRAQASRVAKEVRESILNIRLRALYYEQHSRSPGFC